MLTHRLFSIVSLLVLVLASGCGRQTLDRRDPASFESSENAIRGGATDNGHDAVALLYNDNQGYLCSGTIIDERTYLTAGHCVEDGNPNHYQVAGGTDPFSNPDWIVGVADVIEHPQYDPTSFGVHDVGIVMLSENSPVTPMRWQKLVDDGVYDVGTSFIAVGYGVTSEVANDSGLKRRATMTITQVGSDAFSYGGPTKNICSGDSGGPDLVTINGQETVIGVHSYGDSNCNQFGVSDRTDDNASFISAHVTAGSPGSGKGCGCALDGARSGLPLATMIPAFLAIATAWRRRRT